MNNMETETEVFFNIILKRGKDPWCMSVEYDGSTHSVVSIKQLPRLMHHLMYLHKKGHCPCLPGFSIP